MDAGDARGVLVGLAEYLDKEIERLTLDLEPKRLDEESGSPDYIEGLIRGLTLVEEKMEDLQDGGGYWMRNS